ncbi:coiled-coil domain-containing protein 9 isoform X2 [Chiloscyllium plagiosum]|uniref:coiled-coil domain-containing protein 9 isoform X2 n=1 Tax=Chiloscyllium plagiosum TaxID=36176 RepID=UPI001CB8886C|nr:coiled-coil domain-containing protein 9 isoform X2 [Chiloscyllium plagiosum]
MSMTIDPDLKTREEKDAELDRRIEALRKKNQALMKRHQEIEEDRKKAEEDGISVTSRKQKHEAEHERKWGGKEIVMDMADLSKSPAEKWSVSNRKTASSSRGSLEPPGRRSWTSGPRQEAEDRDGHQRSPGSRTDRMMWGDHPNRSPRNVSGHVSPAAERLSRGDRGGRTRRGRAGGGGPDGGGRGLGTASQQERRVKEWEEKRRQNIEKMNEEMEKIAEYERSQMDGSGEKNPVRNFLDDPRRLGSLPDCDRKDGSRRHVRNWGGPDFDKVKTGLDRGDKEWQGRRSGSKGSVDMTMSMTGRERAEYVRWKKEREQIDQERLERHRNAMGQWRREWDAEKTESMFKDNPVPTGCAEGYSKRGLRNFKRLNLSAKHTDDRRPPKPPTISDFIPASRSKDPKRGRSKQENKIYSMHDNRWETCEAKHEQKEISEQQKEKELKEKPVQDQNQGKADVGEPPADEADDEDEWEDASDDEEEIVGEDVSDSEDELKETKDLEEEEEKKKKDGAGVMEDVAKGAEVVQSPCRSPETSVKEQQARKPRETPKLHIPPQDMTMQPKESGSKPLSPFSLDEYHPVKDWAEEMETTSPRATLQLNPLQTVNATKEEQKVEVKSGDSPNVGESDLEAGKEQEAVTDQTSPQNVSGSCDPADEILKEQAELEIDDANKSGDTATIVVTQATTEKQLNQQEANRRTGDVSEPTTRTKPRTDCVEGNEPSSG